MDVLKAFDDSGDPLLRKRANKMRDCATSTFIVSTAVKARLTVNHCDDRACAPCAGHRTRRVRERFDRVSGDGRLRFITLTQAAIPGESLADARKRLRGSERRLRQRAVWKAHVDGALRAEETTWTDERGAWHVHFHCIYVGRFWPQSELKEAWMACGGGSIVDVRAAYDVAELLKYSLKTANVPSDRIVEWAQSMNGVREVEFLGNWRGELADDVAQEQATAEELSAFRYVGEDYSLEAGDTELISEARLRWVAFGDPDAPPHASSWACDRLRECYGALEKLEERVRKRLDKREKYS